MGDAAGTLTKAKGNISDWEPLCLGSTRADVGGPERLWCIFNAFVYDPELNKRLEV